MPRKLSAHAFTFRLMHAGIAAAFLLAIGYVWWCALTGRRDRGLGLAIVALAGEGVLVIANRGDCPLGGLQERLGDPTPLFELVPPPRAAKLAVPLLGVISGAGVAVVVLRCRGRRSSAAEPPTAGPAPLP